MLGTYTKDTNPVRYRDVAEFVTMSMLMEIAPELRRQGKPVTMAAMQEYRDNWTRDGAPMDFATMKVRPSDLARLLRSTGAENFGSMSGAETLEKGVKARWDEIKAEYDAEAAKGNFLHVVTDPDIRAAILDHAPGVVNRATFVLNGKSARELNHGDAVEFRSYKDPSLSYNVTVNAPGAVPATGFAAANVVGTTPRTADTAQAEALEATRIAELNQDEEFTPQKEQLLGWKGGTVTTPEGPLEYRGLSDIMGAYFTKADKALIAKLIDEKEFFDADTAYNGAELLKHMRSNGYAFNAKEVVNQGALQRNKVEIELTDGERLKLRVIDNDNNGALIGRIYDRYNAYYYNARTTQDNKDSVVFNAADSIAVLEYVAGNRTGVVQKSVSKDTSIVYVDGVDRKKALQVLPNSGRYRSLVFASDTEAREFIEQGIAEAQAVVDASFDVDALQSLIDSGLDNEEVMVTGPEFQAELEALYSPDAAIREAQERAALLMLHSDDGGREHLETVRNAIVGDYDNGFNPSFVLDHMSDTDRGNNRDAMLAAMKVAEYDLSKISGNDFGVNAMKERLVKFNPETARKIQDLDHPLLIESLKTVQKTLKAGGFKGVNGERDPLVEIDDQGVIRWEANRKTGAKSDKAGKQWQQISGEIGQVMVPDENGIIKTKFQGDNNYGIVPGYTGYFAFEGDYDNRMERFRVKGFDQHLQEQLQSAVTHQMTRPLDKTLENIATTLDSSRLNGLYHGDVYGKRVDLDFLETSQLNPETNQAILKTLAGRVRFDNQYSEHATTSAETQANREYQAGVKDEASFSYWNSAGEANMRQLGKEIKDKDGNVIGSDLDNYADTTMTGTGKTQGLIWFLADGAEVNKDGSVTPSKGMMNKDGELVPDTTALQKLPYFDNKKHNAWDRNQMSSNQLMTGLKVDEGVNTALMSFGGWTFDDSYAVSKEFAERNQVLGSKPNENSMRQFDELLHYMAQNEKTTKEQVLAGTGMTWSDAVIKRGAELREATLAEDRGERAKARDTYESYLEEHGRFRPLQRGDKLSDFGGNKGTIGIVIDRDMDPKEAKAQKLDKEVAFMKANPKLDVISAPYSMMSRHNAGVVKELMSGEPQDLYNPETGETLPAAMGKLNIIVTDMVVDDKTHAYSREDVLDGKGRKASGQLAWALQSKGAEGIMNEVYGRNDSAWSTYREYLIATGLDMAPDGTILPEYTPHKGEERNGFEYDSEMDSSQFLEQIKDNGGFLNLPFELEFKNETKTNSLPVLSASLRQNVELVDGSMRVSNFTNHYAKIYESIGEYNGSENPEEKAKAQGKAQAEFDKIQATIIDRQFEGKRSFLRDKIMGKRMQNSATAVAVVDPRLEIGEAGMNQEMMDSLNAKEGDTVMMFRDPVWRDGAIRAMTVKKDDSVHGVAFNPISDKSHDGDFDGDTYGIIKFDTKEANDDLINKFSHAANMIDHGPGKDELYFQSGMDLASAQAKATAAGDTRPETLLKKAHANGMSDNPKVQKAGLNALNDYTQDMFRKYGFASAYVSLESDKSVEASFKQMVDTGAKGSAKKRSLENYMEYHDGKKTIEDARDIQYASGVKSDDTGLAGAFSQKLMALMRNENPKAALEAMYPLTQGTLQIKHDAKHAKDVNALLSDDLNKIFQGKDPKDPKKKLSPNSFNTKLTSIMEDQMKVDVNPEFIQAVTDALTHEGQLLPLKDAMALKGSPMDRVAYGGGYEELKRLSEKKESLLEGKQNELFAPFSMRNATAETKLAKKDTQRVVEPPVLAPTAGSAPKSVDEKVVQTAEVEDVGMVM